MTRRLKGIISLSIALVALLSTQAQAAASVGDVINSVSSSFGKFPNLLSAAAYLIGLFYAVSGIFKFKDHVDHPAQNPLSQAVKRFLAGGALLSLPFMSRATIGTLFKTPGDSVLGATGHNGIVGGGNGLDQMIVNFISNIYGPITTLLNAFTYIAAILLLIVGITRLTKTAQEGPRGPAGLGTIMTFLAAGALFSFGDMMGSFAASLFGTKQVLTKVSVSSTVVDSAQMGSISAVIESLMAFIMIVGFISFLRGWFVLKAFADGSGQATVAQALTFMFGGAMAINLGPLINALQASLGISGLTFN